MTNVDPMLGDPFLGRGGKAGIKLLDSSCVGFKTP